MLHRQVLFACRKSRLTCVPGERSAACRTLSSDLSYQPDHRANPRHSPHIKPLMRTNRLPPRERRKPSRLPGPFSPPPLLTTAAIEATLPNPKSNSGHAFVAPENSSPDVSWFKVDPVSPENRPNPRQFCFRIPWITVT